MHVIIRYIASDLDFMISMKIIAQMMQDSKWKKKKKKTSLAGLEPATFRLTAERANRLRHRDHLDVHGK